MERAIEWALERDIFREAEVRDEKGKRKIGKFQIRQGIWRWCYKNSLIRTWLRATLLPPGVTFMPGSKWARPVYPPATVRVDGGIDWGALLFDAVVLVAAIVLTPGEPVDDVIVAAALREELAGVGTRAAATVAEEAAASRGAIVRTVEELESGLDDAVRSGARGVAEEEGAAAGRGIRTKAPEGTRGVKAGEAPEGTGTGTAGGSVRPRSTARAPAARHTATRVKTTTRRAANNTVIEPGVDVAGDVAEINAGRAARDANGNWVVNGRTYGMHEGGTLFPIEGPGFHPLSRGGFKALGAYNEFGNTAEAVEWMTRNKISAQAQAEGLRAYEAIHR